MDKQIAIFGFKTGENSYGLTIPYYDFFSYFGDVHVLTPLEFFDFSLYDLLVVPGGPDVDPNVYGDIPSMRTGKSDPIREYFDKYILPEAISYGIPIAGICRGHQSIAVHFGSSINQHMYHGNSNPRTELIHGINVITGELPEELGKILRGNLGVKKAGKNKHNKTPHPTNRYIEVNSLHHQTVNGIPDEAVLLASHFSEKEGRRRDRSIEALFYPAHNIATFQYHPEEIWDDLSMFCIEYLLSQKTEKHETKKEISEVSV